MVTLSRRRRAFDGVPALRLTVGMYLFYPDVGGVQDRRMMIPQGQPVDVIHGGGGDLPSDVAIP